MIASDNRLVLYGLDRRPAGQRRVGKRPDERGLAAGEKEATDDEGHLPGRQRSPGRFQSLG